jgi:hypothetical protein
MTQCNVTAALVVEDIADFGKRLHNFPPRYNRQMAHTSTSTTSSEIAGGIGSPCCCKLST